MKLKITKSKGSLLLELPPELLLRLQEGESLELELPAQKEGRPEAREGVAKGAGIQKEGRSLLSDEERALLLKLNAVKFDRRIPSEVNRLLSGAEKSTLVQLIEKRFLVVFKSKKYPGGVYNIADNIYPELRRAEQSPSQKSGSPAAAAPAYQKQSSTSSSPAFVQLASSGFLIVENEIEAKMLSEQLGDRIKNGEVLGVRGFDKKFYVATKSFYLQHESRIVKALTREGKTLDQLSAELKLPADAAKILLTLMADSGEIIEKRRGVFASA